MKRYGICSLIILLLIPLTSASLLTVHFIDVGQGDSALIEYDGHTMLIDSGPTILSYLKSQGIDKLDFLVSSHPHADHIGGMVDIIKSMPVDVFVDNGATHTAPAYRDLMKLILRKQTPYATVEKGQSIPYADDVSVKVTNPEGLSGDINEDSMALLLTYGDVKIFFPGDCESCDASCDVVKLAHHGSGGSATRGILKGDDPDYAVISLAEDNEYNYPSPNTLNALKNSGIHVYRTDLDGTVVLRTDGKTYWFE